MRVRRTKSGLLIPAARFPTRRAVIAGLAASAAMIGHNSNARPWLGGAAPVASGDPLAHLKSLVAGMAHGQWLQLDSGANSLNNALLSRTRAHFDAGLLSGGTPTFADDASVQTFIGNGITPYCKGDIFPATANVAMLGGGHAESNDSSGYIFSCDAAAQSILASLGAINWTLEWPGCTFWPIGHANDSWNPWIPSGANPIQTPAANYLSTQWGSGTGNGQRLAAGHSYLNSHWIDATRYLGNRDSLNPNLGPAIGGIEILTMGSNNQTIVANTNVSSPDSTSNALLMQPHAQGHYNPDDGCYYMATGQTLSPWNTSIGGGFTFAKWQNALTAPHLVFAGVGLNNLGNGGNIPYGDASASPADQCGAKIIPSFRTAGKFMYLSVMPDPNFPFVLVVDDIENATPSAFCGSLVGQVPSVLQMLDGRLGWHWDAVNGRLCVTVGTPDWYDINLGSGTFTLGSGGNSGTVSGLTMTLRTNPAPSGASQPNAGPSGLNLFCNSETLN